MKLPNPLQPGDPIRASWLNQLLNAIRPATHISGGPGIKVAHHSTGVTVSAIEKSQPVPATGLIYPVTVEPTNEETAAGDEETDCDFEYKVFKIGATEPLLGSDEQGATPLNDGKRLPKVTYAAGTYGIAWQDENKDWVFHVLDEVPEIEDEC